VAEHARWIDLVDPDEKTLREQAPVSLHPTALAQLLAPHEHDDEPRPTIESHGDYIFGVLLVGVVVDEEDRVYYQEVDFVLTADTLLSVSKTPPGEQPFDPAPAKEACKGHEATGMYAFHLVDEVAERYLVLVDDLNSEIDEIEDLVDEGKMNEVRERLSQMRRDFLQIRRTLTPTRDAVHKIVDGRVAIEGPEVFPRDVQLHFADAYDKLLRAWEGLDLSRDLVSGVRDYAQSRIAIDQNEVMKRLTAIAALLLVPTFIVGLYGQNFRHIPELHWQWGYWWSWGWIVATTIAQIVFYRRKGWL
jgi:magnesium transporter